LGQDSFDSNITNGEEGSVGINSYTHYIPSNIPIYTLSSIGLDIMGLYTSRLDYYLFDKNKSVKIKKFWNSFGEKLTKILDFKINRNDPSSNIKNALHRFNYACQRGTGEDAMADYVISLEALLSKKCDPLDSLNYRLSLRTAKLLEKTQTERSARFKEITKMYGTRSKIVHGERSAKNYNLVDTHKTISESIKKYLILLDRHSHDEIISRLEYS
jgi:hypothetical protein